MSTKDSTSACISEYAVPEQRNEIFNLTVGSVFFSVDSKTSGRIVSLKFKGGEVLTQKDVHPENYGSTLWDAPQSNWGWPPRKALDGDSYQAVIENNSIIMTGKPDSVSGLQFTKVFKGNITNQTIEIDYCIKNISQKAVNVGPWEVTRVPGSLTFFPLGEKTNIPESNLPGMEYINDIAWYTFNAADLPTGKKLFSSASEGWLAHVTQNRLLFVKQFPDTHAAQYAPQQAEVEIWGQDGAIYVEIENHGPYTQLAPGEMLTYPVVWRLVELPRNIEVKSNNAQLATFVRNLIINK